MQKAIPIFEILHPKCISIFCFDQSTNHNTMVKDALIIIRMNLESNLKCIMDSILTVLDIYLIGYINLYMSN